jgi:predicted ester cyclase
VGAAPFGDQVIVRLAASGRHVGVGRLPVNGGLLVGVEPTRKRYSVQHIHWFTLRDGFIIEHRANRDNVGMMVQLGLLPAPPPFGAPPNP